MLQFKLFCFALGILVSVCGGTETDFDSVGIKRSAVCLIERVAQHNNLTVHYEKVNLQHHKNGTTHTKCKLELGTEQYTANSTSYAKAKEKVAREAYALTKYSKPPIGNKTCLVHTEQTKSDISLLQEYARAIGKEVRFNELPQNGQQGFEIEVSLDDKKASGKDAKKKGAKALAAKNLIDKINRIKIIDQLALKYNRTEFHGMNPVLRLRKIARITEHQVGDAEYTKMSEVLEPKTRKIKSVVVQVQAHGYVTTGTGPTYQAASLSAATNLLRTMHFTVTFNSSAHP